MIEYIKKCDEGTPLHEVVYSFLQPVELKIQLPDDKIQSVGFGIGDTVSVLEPVIQYLTALHDKHEKIPMTDGSFIIEWPDGLSNMVECIR